ncbi:MAG: hypothetical protein IJ068_01010 [Bacilli bacterium]|nr:hypothetical protein [Bacilli bacterium]
MKKFIKDYIKIISTTLIGLVFVLASFYLMINYNHSEEIKKQVYISYNDSRYQEGQEILRKINDNLVKFQNNSNKSNAKVLMYNSILNCYNVLQSEGTFFTLKPEKSYSSYEIYELGENFQSKLINSCYVLNLSYLKTEDLPNEFKDVAPFVTSYVDSINANVQDSLAEIENNSSYFYTTNITSATIRNYLNSDYSTIANAYIDFANIILNLSENINSVGEGV